MFRTQPDHSSPAKRSFLRSSIVWKLTLFVGVLVALNCGVLIGVAYIATSAILRDQIHERLSTVAADRQEMLAYTLEQQRSGRRSLPNGSRIHQLLAERAEGTITPERFRAETETDPFDGADQHDRVSGSLDRGRHGAGACLERPRGSGCRRIPG